VTPLEHETDPWSGPAPLPADIDAWRDVPWRVLRTPAWPGAENMAADLALLDVASSSPFPIWTLRLYSWARPTLSFGRNEAARRHFSPDGLLAAGVDAVRRPTGGRALLHAREVTYSLTGSLPMDAPWRDVYDDINATLVDALVMLGVDAVLATAPAGDARGRACFDRPSPGEVTVDGRKIVGSAVWRRAHGFLQHGSILLDDDQTRIPQLANGTMPDVPPPATLRSLLAAMPSTTVIEEAIIDALARRRGAPATSLDASDTALLDARSAHLAAMQDPAWVWRQ
jgi:lipoyl(octanoyl) transferase